MKPREQMGILITNASNGAQSSKEDAYVEENDSTGIERESWSRKTEYLLSLLGYSVGVGNIWRFPYICNRNGGGAFLLPYVICLGCFGLPLYFLETSLGQFSGKSPFHVWGVCPLFKGVGYGIFMMEFLGVWYYIIIMSWSLYYLGSSFQSTVPWSRCDQWWNTPGCMDVSRGPANMTSQTTTVPYNSSLGGENQTLALESWKRMSAAEEFWQHNVLQVSSGPHELGHIVWYLALCQCVMTFIMFLALFKGIRTSGKVVYVTASAPYILLVVFLIRGVTLPGAVEGILFFITPDFSRLKEPKVWIEAALQVFYSLGPGWGPVIALSSYNKFNNNCLRDSIMLSVVGEAISILGGFAIFSILGYMAKAITVPINKVVSSGPGLAFIVYPEAISLMPLPQLWAVLFFFMIITAVFDTVMGAGETVLTILTDQFPRVLMRHRLLLSASFFLLLAVTSLILVTQGGVYIFQLIDWFNGSYTVTVIAFLECVVLAWIYGADRFGEDIEMMMGRKPPMIMKLLWGFITPSILLVLLVFTLAMYEAPTYGDYTYGSVAVAIGWVIATVTFVPIPLHAVYLLCRTKGTLLQRLKQTTSPDDQWGPSDPKRRRLYRQHMLQRAPRHSCLDIIRN